MAVLLDTNILLRMVQPQHPQCAVAARALHGLRRRNEALLIAQQNIVEFWAVTTRPVDVNGLGWATEHAAAEVASLRKLFSELPELPIQETWERLVLRYGVSGKNIHDARLVAAMVVHHIPQILTFNGHDFARYREIQVLDPMTLERFQS
jgi:predicted nucleic acid-binding protein